MMKQVLLGLVFLAAVALQPCSSHGSEIVFSSYRVLEISFGKGGTGTDGFLGIEDYVMETTFDGNVDLVSFDFLADFSDANLSSVLGPVVLNFDWQNSEGNSVANFDATS